MAINDDNAGRIISTNRNSERSRRKALIMKVNDLK